MSAFRPPGYGGADPSERRGASRGCLRRGVVTRRAAWEGKNGGASRTAASGPASTDRHPAIRPMGGWDRFGQGVRRVEANPPGANTNRRFHRRLAGSGRQRCCPRHLAQIGATSRPVAWPKNAVARALLLAEQDARRAKLPTEGIDLLGVALSAFRAQAGACQQRPVNIAPVGTAPLGAGLWGQLDRTGEVYQWILDTYADYVDPCKDCASPSATLSDRVRRGGAFGYDDTVLTPSIRLQLAPTHRDCNFGFPCARTP